MPITFITMFISTFAISGIFPFAGFWSKDEILMTAFEHNKLLWIIGSVASIMTAFYMFRLMYLTFFKEFRGTNEQKQHLHESPILITLPLLILAALATVGGLINLPGNNWLNRFLEPILAIKIEHKPLDETAYMLMGIALLGAILGIVWAFTKYNKQGYVPKEDSEITGFSKIIYNKYYVDEIYTLLVINPINSISNFFRKTLEPFISSSIYGLGILVNGMATQGKNYNQAILVCTFLLL